jgi:hypothetical protein
LANGRPEYNNATNQVQGVTGAGDPGRLVLEFTPSIMYAPLFTGNINYYNTLKNAFISIGTSGTAGVTVTGITLEKLW